MIKLKMKNKIPHPLQAKFDDGTLAPLNYWDISDEEWADKISQLSADEQEAANWYRQEKINERHGNLQQKPCRIAV
ncbi:MAG: hypothetical protein FWC16_04540 [Defluviitaleaceae bacterium]|nr:hypothetical protein [Defluviitaleaceae bacterium]MCL2274176.1 hypothetical protein [Defluviitaleaceae bacterium]